MLGSSSKCLQNSQIIYHKYVSHPSSQRGQQQTHRQANPPAAVVLAEVQLAQFRGKQVFPATELQHANHVEQKQHPKTGCESESTG